MASVVTNSQDLGGSVEGGSPENCLRVNWDTVIGWTRDLMERTPVPAIGVYGVQRGGIPVAQYLSQWWGVPMLSAEDLEKARFAGPDSIRGILVVDDIIDQGATRERFAEFQFAALVAKLEIPSELLGKDIRDPSQYSLSKYRAHAACIATPDTWVVFPWEEQEQAGPEENVRRILQFIGEDPTRPGLVDTPARVCRSLLEMTQGYAQDPAEILRTQFDCDEDQMVLVRDIAFTSMCEHHMLPFTGYATVGYIPGIHIDNGEGIRKIVGLSKIPRLVECFARRLQIQERMTGQIANALVEYLSPMGVGVIVSAQHSCMSCRGVNKSEARMVTTALRGAMLESAQARAEFLGFGQSAKR